MANGTNWWHGGRWNHLQTELMEQIEGSVLTWDNNRGLWTPLMAVIAIEGAMALLL